jgi:hypothetical protein
MAVNSDTSYLHHLSLSLYQLIPVWYFCGRAQYGIEEMCRDQWNWAKKNPYGYCGSAEK